MKQNRLKRTLGDVAFSTFFSLPSVLLYIVFMILPLIFVIYLSFTQWTGAGDINFVGVANYQFLFNYSDFWQIMRNTGVLILLHVCFQIPLAALVAFLLFRTKQGFRFFRAVYFLSSIIAATVIGLMFSVLLNSDIGPINSILRSMGLNWMAKSWLSDPDIAMYTVTFIQVWQYIGYYMAIILAGMQSISDEVIESALIDGVNSRQLAWHIVFPQIKPVLEICFIFCLTGCLKSFEHAFITTWGGPGVASTTLALYMYKLAFSSSELGKGATIAVIIVIGALVLTRITGAVFKDSDQGGKNV